ncbi:MAG: transcription elongation factor GreA, partial [Gammaproteobacteria bacterium RIFOXYB2_FULL_38_6]
MKNTFPMTVEGAKKLRDELTHLKTVERPRIIQAIAEARAHGDLKENAEYHAAKEQQSFIEGRIQEVEGKLAHAQVIDVTQMPNTGKVIFGATVTLLNLDTEEEIIYKIVGEDESDIQSGKIAINAPIARALIGKMVDDIVEVKTPGGVVA